MTPPFREFCAQHGLLPPAVIPPDRWIRCPTTAKPHSRNGAIILSGNGGAGAVQDWATMSEPIVWKANGDEAPRESPALVAQRARERARLSREAIEGARAFWRTCSPLHGPTAYLERKGLGVEGCAGVRLGPRGELVIPMERGGELVSVQRIAPDGDKKFWPGAPSKGASFTISRPRSTVTVLCEGFATGATVFAAIPEASVIVTFSAGNLVEVAEGLKVHGMVAVACDDDHETAVRIGKNPGREAGERAAALLGCGCAVPEAQSFSGSDWNDFYSWRLRVLNDDRMLSSFKKRPEMLRRTVLSEIRAAVMRCAVFRA